MNRTTLDWVVSARSRASSGLDMVVTVVVAVMDRGVTCDARAMVSADASAPAMRARRE